MTETEQARAFGKELKKLVNRFALEFEITYSSLVGELEFMKAELIKQAFEEDKEDS